MGVTVVGASSMGALRAAGFDGFGMVGVGEVYRRFRSGEPSPTTRSRSSTTPSREYALSEPLVNIRATLEAAVADGEIAPADADAVLAAAQALYFPERTWPAILRRAAVAEAVREALARRPPVDLKRADAIAALGTPGNSRPSNADTAGRGARPPRRSGPAAGA